AVSSGFGWRRIGKPESRVSQFGGRIRIDRDPHSPRLLPMSEETIFAAALDLPPDDRPAFLAKACGNDSALRKRVDGLLTASEQAGEFMARPAVAAAHPADSGTQLLDGNSTPNDVTVTRAGQEKAADDEVPLGFLAPARRPGSLGRIGHYEVLEVLGKG